MSQKIHDDDSLFRIMIEQSGEEVYLMRPDRSIAFANETAAMSLGYTIEELLSMKITDIDNYISLHTGGEDDLFNKLRRKKTFTFDTLHQSKNDTRTFKRVKAAYLTYKGDEFIGLYAYDISAKMESELDILRREERFRNIFEQSSDGIFITGINGTIIEWNEKIEQLTGIPKIDAVDKNISDIYRTAVPGSTSHEIKHHTSKYESMLSLIRKGILVQDSFETTLRSANGSLHEVQHFVFPVTSIQDGGFLVGNIIRDITDRIKLEDERIRAQKLESLGILAGGIAHDFRNILSAILGNITLAGMDVDPLSSQHRYLSSAETAVLRAKDLTSRLLTFSKGGEPIKSIISVSDLIEESANLILTGSNITCSYNLDESLSGVLADKVQISQVIQNIVINAMQSMPEGGLLKISSSAQALNDGQVLLLPAGPYARISVSDTGQGIPKDHLEKIFDPYFTTKPDGTGLGLSVVYSIIRKHGGNITVRSVWGQGTTFTVYLPLFDTHKDKHNEVELPAQPLRGSGHILVIDDEDIVRGVIKNLLRSIGYSAEATSTVEEGLELYRMRKKEGKAFDAVIMDLTIRGGVSGRKGVKLFKDQHPESKIIVASGYSNDPVLSRYEDYGFFDALVKPIELRELSRVIKKAVC